jgi:transposase
MKKNPSTLYVGVDIAKATLQVHLQGRQFSFPNNPTGHIQLCQRLRPLGAAHVVCEATGGYERALVQACHQDQIPVSVLNPAHVRAAAQAQGKRAKSDPLDAAGLTDYGQRFQPQATAPLRAVQRQLAELTTWLSQLIQAQATAKAQAEHHTLAFVREQHALQLAHSQSQIQALEAQIQALLQQDAELKRRVDCLDAIVGVGPRTAWMVLADMPELGQLNRGQTAALAGLAPWPQDSGQKRGWRSISGGRTEVRRHLYMPALAATRSNPVLRSCYQRLTAKNKPHKVALTAVMRKLLVYMNQELKKLAAQPPIEQAQKSKKPKKVVAK